MYRTYAVIYLICILIGIAAAVGLAFIPATIAKRKGYSYGLWWLFGFLLFLVALIVILVIPDKTQQNPASPNASPAPLSEADQLKICKDLLDQGILTQAEFDQKKAEILRQVKY